MHISIFGNAKIIFIMILFCLISGIAEMNLTSLDPFVIGRLTNSDLNINIFDVQGEITDFTMVGLKNVTVKTAE